MSDWKRECFEKTGFALGGEILLVAEERARHLAPLVAQRRLLHEINRFPEVFTAYVFFFFHLLDRTAYAHSRDSRDVLLDLIRPRLIETVVGVLRSDAPLEKQQEFIASMETMLDQHQMRLTQAAKREPDNPLHVLLREFGTLVAELIERPGDASVILNCSAEGAESIKQLNFISPLKELSSAMQTGSAAKVTRTCRGCGGKFVVPTGVGRIRAKCPRCGQSLELRT
jgi:RNase P subunit RPR2